MLLRRPNTFRRLDSLEKKLVFKGGLFTTNDPKVWGRVRRLTAPAFSHANVDKMLPALAQV